MPQGREGDFRMKEGAGGRADSQEHQADWGLLLDKMIFWRVSPMPMGLARLETHCPQGLATQTVRKYTDWFRECELNNLILPSHLVIRRWNRDKTEQSSKGWQKSRYELWHVSWSSMWMDKSGKHDGRSEKFFWLLKSSIHTYKEIAKAHRIFYEKSLEVGSTCTREGSFEHLMFSFYTQRAEGSFLSTYKAVRMGSCIYNFLF